MFLLIKSLLCFVGKAAREAVESAVAVVAGTKPRMISLLYYALYTNSAGGSEALVDTREGCAEEFRIDVSMHDRGFALE